MTWTLDDLLKINEGNTNLYTPYSNPGVYTINADKRASQSDILAQLLANPNQGLINLDQELVATNQNDQWNRYGYYSLDNTGKLQYSDAGTLHADLGNVLDLEGTLYTPYGELTPRKDKRIDASNGNDRWNTYGLYDTSNTLRGNAGTVHYDTGDDGGFNIGTVLSLGTGGLSDVVQGQAPFSSAIENAGENLGINQHTQDWMKGLSADLFSGGFAQLPKAYEKATEGGGFQGGTFIDRAVDPAGTIDYTVREMGDVHRAVAPGLTDYAQEIGSAVGGVIGSIVPVVGTGVGAAIGSGIGSKTAGGTTNYDYTGDLTDAGVAYIAAEATPNVAGPVSGGVSPYIGQTAGKIVGGVAQGALRGAAGGVKGAYENESLMPILQGAGIGGVAGGLGAAYSEFNTPTQLTPEEQFYVDKMSGVVSEGVTGQPAITPQVSYEQGLGGLSSYSGEVLPQFSVDPALFTPTLNPITDYTMGGATSEPEYKGSVQEGAKSPEFGEGYKGAFYADGKLTTPPSFMDTLGEYAGKVGEIIQNNSGALKNLAQTLAKIGTPVIDTGAISEEGPKGRPAAEQAWLSEMMKSGTGVGKSKSLEAGYVEGPRYDANFFTPNKRIKKYTNTGLYE